MLQQCEDDDDDDDDDDDVDVVVESFRSGEATFCI